MDAPRPVLLIAYDAIQLLDLAGPLEVLDTASRVAVRAGRAGYDVRVATPGGRPVRSTSGLEVAAHVDLYDPRLHPLVDGPGGERLHTLVVVGGTGSRAARRDDALLAAVRSLAAQAERITSVCTGALVLASAGLLDGHRATTHWASCALLAEHGEIEVLPDRLYVRDRDRWTSAGVTAGIDLALALVEDDLGPEVAHEVAGHLVVFARRPGGQAQFSASLRAQAARTPAVADLQRWLPDHLTDDLTVERLAERAGVSPRTLARTFKAETGTTPAAHVEELRVEAARRLLETTDATVATIARQVGLRHAETLHRSFARRVGTTPDQYRRHFARATTS